jgi:hypothetical protein
MTFSALSSYGQDKQIKSMARPKPIRKKSEQ